ncbi:hypothetical protein ACFQE8_18890 [Salinirubellus sp. GCM10025818]|uniref:hypothetical protein n=1 Tax=Salinirubellus TaxID=2162630 RepID=UPI0030D514CC
MNDIEESGFAGGGRRKAELVCPTCGRTAPLGEWAVTERDAEDRSELAYECPECSTVVVTQPRFERSERAHPA